jgi:hypothetical protein
VRESRKKLHLHHEFRTKVSDVPSSHLIVDFALLANIKPTFKRKVNVKIHLDGKFDSVITIFSFVLPCNYSEVKREEDLFLKCYDLVLQITIGFMVEVKILQRDVTKLFFSICQDKNSNLWLETIL